MAKSLLPKNLTTTTIGSLPKNNSIPTLDLSKFKKDINKINTYDPGKQVEGYKKRLEATGIDPEKALDSRNFVERALNLTPDQNVLFDVFEILERPQQALFGAWKASQEGKDVREALKAGITGNDVVRFKEVLHNYGMRDTAEKFGVDDVVGFLGDVLLDPMDIPLLPVKGSKTAIQAAVKTADTTLDALSAANKAGDAAKALNLAKDLSKAENAVKMLQKTRLMSPIEGVFRVAKKGGEVTLKLTDKGLTKVFETLDAASIRKINTGGVSDALHLAESYTDIKKRLLQIFDAAKQVPKSVMEKFRKNIGKEAWTKAELDIVSQNWVKNVLNSTAARKGIPEDEFSELVMGLVEYTKYRPKLSFHDMLFKGQAVDMAFDQKTVDNLDEFIQQYLPGVYKKEDLFTKTTKDGVDIYYFKNDAYIDDIKNELKKVYDKEFIDEVVSKVDTVFEPEIGSQTPNRLNLREVSRDDFRKTFESERLNTPRPEYLSEADDLGEGRGFLSADGKQGIFVENDGRITSVFNSSKDVKGASEELIIKALENGGNRLDNFDGFLTENYAKYGFEPVAKIKFDPAQAPKGWKPEYGQPDVVFMVHNGDDVATVLSKKGTYKTEKVSDLPYSVDWDAAEALQKSKVVKKPNEIISMSVPTKGTTWTQETVTTKSFKSVEDALATKIDAPRFYTEAQAQKYQKLMQDKEIMGVVDSAQNLMNTMLTKIDEAFGTAMQKGTPEGYLKHALTPERKAVLNQNKLNFEKMDSSKLKGNVNEFTGRQYKMSAEEANFVYQDKIKRYLDSGFLSPEKQAFWESNQGMKLFETAINSSLDDFVESAPSFAKDIKQIDDILLGATFMDPDLVQAVNPGEKIGMRYQQISRADVERKLKGFEKYLPDATKASFERFIKQLPKSPTIKIDKTIFEMIGRLGNKKEINQFVRLLDVINNSFKKFKLLSPGFQMRNFVGNSSNMYLAGMSATDIAQGYSRANKILTEAPEIMRKATIEGVETLTDAQRKIYDTYKDFVQSGFHDISKEVWDVEKIIKEKGFEGKRDIVSQISDLNFNMNQKADERFRLAMLMWIKDNPAAMNKMGLDNPYTFVRTALFDPKDLSGTEKDILKRLIPFYTFTKKNLAFQMKNIFDNPSKYNHLRKTIRATWDAFADIDVNDIESYKKENFWIPIPGITKDGKYSAIKLNLPMGDLAEFIEEPGRKILSSVSPAIRAPFELMTNTQIYTGMPIEEFKGQEGYIMPGLSRKAEYGLSQLGLDVPLGLMSDIGRTTKAAVQGQLKGQPLGQTLRQATGRSMFSEGSVEQAKLNKDYQQLEDLRQLMRYYKQENIDILTMAEAENRSKPLSQLTARLKSLSGV